MELARTVYSRDLKIAAMRAMDAGETRNQVARRLQLSPKLLERWRGEWRARGEAAFPGQGHRQEGSLASDEARIAELERKIGQLTVENDFLKKALVHFSAAEGHGERGARPVSTFRFYQMDNQARVDTGKVARVRRV
jgi:transposase